VYRGGEQLKKKLILIGIAILVVLLTTWTIWGNVTVGITHYTVLSEKIPAAFNHYRISVVSDLHNAHFGKNNGNIASLIEKQKPDMIAITGDLVDSSKTNIEIAESLIQRLVKIAPCYYVTGNHEAWIGEKYQELEKKLIDAGVIVLHDESMELAKNNETILLAGLDDPDFTDRDSSIQ
jgi:predicted MPP superfamily phosphohydrolase